MHVAALTVELHLPSAHSLKDKRGIIRPVLDGSRQRFHVAAAEVDWQDKWQRALLGMVSVASSPSQAESVLDAVERFVWSFPEIEVTACQRDRMKTEMT